MDTADSAWVRAFPCQAWTIFQPIDQLDRIHQSPGLKLLPVSGQTFMHIVGVTEMIVGLAILAKWTHPGACVASAWLVAIAINLISTGMFFDVTVRCRDGDGGLRACAYDGGSPRCPRDDIPNERRENAAVAA